MVWMFGDLSETLENGMIIVLRNVVFCRMVDHNFLVLYSLAECDIFYRCKKEMLDL